MKSLTILSLLAVIMSGAATYAADVKPLISQKSTQDPAEIEAINQFGRLEQRGVAAGLLGAALLFGIIAGDDQSDTTSTSTSTTGS